MRWLVALCFIAACDSPAAKLDASIDAPPAVTFPGCAPEDASLAPVCSGHLCWVAPSAVPTSVVSISGSTCDYWLASDSVYRMNGYTISAALEHVAALGVYVLPAEVWVAGSSGVRRFDGEQWTIIDPTASGSVWASAPDDVWITRNQGIAHWDGQTIALMFANTSSSFAIWGTSKDDVRALDVEGILHWDGNAWTREQLGDDSFPRALWGDADAGWYVGAVGPATAPEIWHRGPSGWELVYTEDAGGYFDAVWGSSANDVWAGGLALGHVVHFDGTSWTRIELPPQLDVISIHGTSPDDVVFGGRGLVGRWDGHAIALSTTLPLAFGETRWTGMYGVNADDVWAVADRGTIAHWDGVKWTPSRLENATLAANAISGTSDDDLWVAGAFGPTMHVWHHAGTDWTKLDLGVSGVLRAIHAAAPDDAWAVGDHGTIFHYDGTAWTQLPSPTQVRLAGVWGSNRDAWAVGSFVILHWDGHAWSQVNVVGGGPYTSVWMRATNEVYIGGGSGALIRFDGHEFHLTSVQSSAVTSIGGDATVMWTTGTNEATFNRGFGLYPLFTPSATWFGAYFPSRTDGWIAGSGGVIMRYRP